VGKDGPEVLGEWELARAANPAGGIVSTAGDQLRYARFHMGDGRAADGTQLLSKESLAGMQTPTVKGGNGIGALGVTWMLREVGGVRLVGHGGATNGLMSAFQMAPDRDFAITVLTNAYQGTELHRNVVNWALKQCLAIEEGKPIARKAAPEALNEFAGRYSALLSDLLVTAKDGALEGQVIPKGGFPTKDSPPRPMEPPFPIGLSDPDRLVILDGPMKDSAIDVLRDENGRITFVRLGYRLLQRRD
jgi:CubicO group peptidase (beta-lactamase class C family)